jgi:hypothetical protein
MRSLPSTILALGLLAASLLLSGCATGATSAAMSSTTRDFGRQHPHTLSLSVTGGRDTSSAGASQISDADFAAAIRSSIQQSALFTKVLEGNASDYTLSVFIVRLEQPTFGMTFDVTIETNWTLTRRADSKVFWQKSLTSTGTATMGDAFSGVTRLRLANEKAARMNIEAALKELSTLSLN